MNNPFRRKQRMILKPIPVTIDPALTSEAFRQAARQARTERQRERAQTQAVKA